MALISLSDWIDLYGDEPDAPEPVAAENVTWRIEVEAAPALGDYRITTALPIGSEIAATRTRLL